MSAKKDERINKLLKLSPQAVNIIKTTAYTYTNGNQSIAADQLIKIGEKHYKKYAGEILASKK